MLAPWKESYDNLSILKSRDITLPTKVHIVKPMVFPVVMNRCESWTIKKAECQRIDAFELCCWRRLLRVPWTTRRSNKSMLKEINLDYSLDRPMMKLKLQNVGHLMRRGDSLENTLMLGKVEGRRRRGQQRLDGMMTQGTWVWANSRRWWRTGKPVVLQPMESQSHSDETEQQQWQVLKKNPKNRPATWSSNSPPLNVSG